MTQRHKQPLTQGYFLFFSKIQPKPELLRQLTQPGLQTSKNPAEKRFPSSQTAVSEQSAFRFSALLPMLLEPEVQNGTMVSPEKS